MAEPIVTAGGIYVIRNLKTGNVYVGSSDNIERRVRAHINLLARGRHHSIKLQRAWDKHGSDLFAFETLEVVADVERLVEREQEYIDSMGAFGRGGYNMIPNAGSTRGVKRPPMSAEQRAKIAATNTGRIHTEESKQKISKANRGLKRSAEHCARMSERMKGGKLTPETIAKRSAKMTGRKYGPMTEERRASISAAKKGQKWTDDRREIQRKSGLFKPVMIGDVIYETQSAAVAALGRSVNWLLARIRSGEARFV
jgi:group I intron endonuclease